jgi:hypothetical protein
LLEPLSHFLITNTMGQAFSDAINKTIRVFFYKNIQDADNKIAPADRPDIANMMRPYFSLKSTLLSLTFSFVSGCADFGSIRNILSCSTCFDRRI